MFPRGFHVIREILKRISDFFRLVLPTEDCVNLTVQTLADRLGLPVGVIIPSQVYAQLFLRWATGQKTRPDLPKNDDAIVTA